MASTLEILNLIYDQIKNKNEWGQGALYSKDGSRLCLMARIYAINDITFKVSVKNRLYQALAELNKPLDLSSYNDQHTHAEVLQLITRAVMIEKKSVSDYEASFLRIS